MSDDQAAPPVTVAASAVPGVLTQTCRVGVLVGCGYMIKQLAGDTVLGLAMSDPTVYATIGTLVATVAWGLVERVRKHRILVRLAGMVDDAVARVKH
jgi:hypothetical protein